MTKINGKRWFLIIVLMLCSAGSSLSICHIIKHKTEEDQINSQLEEIEQITEVVVVEDTNSTETIIQEEEPPKENPYWDYIEKDLITVNFNDLKKINNDIVGWIQIDNTNINYPFVQTNNNEYYLTHSINKTKNSAGWVFLDFRNNLTNFEDKNTIIYAHGRADQTMFGTLKNILTNGWLNNLKNHTIKLSTEYENTLWQVFSVYRIPTTSDYLQISFISAKEFENFAKMLIKRSARDFYTAISKDDRILTLSTCYDKNDKVVLHAKLIKREIR